MLALFCASLFAVAAVDSTNATTQVEVSAEDDADAYDLAARKTAHDLYASWLKESAADRQKNIEDVLAAVVRASDKDAAAEIARGGPNLQRMIALPDKATLIRLQTLSILPGPAPKDDASRYEHGAETLFRRITADRFEAWTSTDGWLFDGHGRLLHHVKVPRRDGNGRAWFGAFLPSGRWITTDLWSDDRQLNCFSPEGKWLWELRGRDALPKEVDSDETEEMIRWARSDKEGKGWVASVGAYGPNYVWISADGKARAIASNGPWECVYPRSMAAKGTYLELSVPSDDGKATLTQNSAGHGDWIDFPQYNGAKLPANMVIPDGDVYFGFWPGSHATWMETDKDVWQDGKRENEDKKTWFFDAAGKYQFEILGSWMGDAADGKSLLLQDAQYRVIRMSPDGQVDARRFQEESKTMQPLALYDDLKLGFFLNPETNEVVLAKW